MHRNGKIYSLYFSIVDSASNGIHDISTISVGGQNMAHPANMIRRFFSIALSAAFEMDVVHCPAIVFSFCAQQQQETQFHINIEYYDAHCTSSNCA